MTTPVIKLATESDGARVIDALLLAFTADPATRWCWPDPELYLKTFPSFAKVFGGYAFQHRSAYITVDYAGAALWLPPGTNPDEDALIATLRRTVSANILKDVLGVFERMGNYHPSEPHWYLPLIGVDPSRQGQGYGSALMRQALVACDRAHQLAYLESSNPRNIPLYERHGFKLLGSIQVGSSPPIHPMLREPEIRRGQGTSA